jgi:maltose O-acetyltransferase
MMWMTEDGVDSTRTQRQKMAAGDWYSCIDDELAAIRTTARAAVHAHNTLPPDQRGNMAIALRTILGSAAPDVMIEAPFHCAYGFNIHLGASVYLNAGCILLDTAPVRIGANTLLGPAVQIYCAEHHQDAQKRSQGMEIAKPITIGNKVWIGGGAVILAGVSIGDRAIVGAGSVVTRDVAPDSLVKGNPARVTR